MREKWTDERLDDLNHKVDSGFDRVDRDLALLRTDMNAGFDRVDSRLDRIDSRLDGMQRAMMQFAAVLSGAMVTGFVATIALAVA